jgi:fumarate reductase subunit D
VLALVRVLEPVLAQVQGLVLALGLLQAQEAAEVLLPESS